ncbi:YciI-like protein [Leadbetterella sp. DM7]|uniref:YciI-like protein n=1 Tax=Leadbetterella sp. DM7 TaxID=3235085 RepID=UPI00349E5E2F
MYYILFYKTVEDYVEKRISYREEHLQYARTFQKKGSLVLAGALADPVDGALLVFRGESPEIAREFARNDPYVKNGLITGWEVREWTVVIGNE